MRIKKKTWILTFESTTQAMAADKFGLPVSTTHVLNSAVAGTMSANKSGLQWSTVKSILMAWVLTLPCAMLLSAALYWILLSFTR